MYGVTSRCARSRMERGERGDAVLTQFDRYLAWGEIGLHT